MSQGLPASLWIEGELRRLQGEGTFVTLVNRGNAASGTVLVLLRGREGKLRVFSQARDPSSGKLLWFPAFNGAAVDPGRADAYSHDALEFDPDLWVLEIETDAETPPLQDNC